MSLIVGLLFVFALGLTWYQNKFIVLSVVRRPLVLCTAQNQIALWFVRLLVAYGSIAGFFLVFGIPLGLAAFIGYWLFSEWTFRRYFNRETSRIARLFLESESGSDPATAFESARRIVEGNIKNAGRGSVFS
jgi:hypothetical protein